MDLAVLAGLDRCAMRRPGQRQDHEWGLMIFMNRGALALTRACKRVGVQAYTGQNRSAGARVQV